MRDKNYTCVLPSQQILIHVCNRNNESKLSFYPSSSPATHLRYSGWYICECKQSKICVITLKFIRDSTPPLPSVSPLPHRSSSSFSLSALLPVVAISWHYHQRLCHTMLSFSDKNLSCLLVLNVCSCQQRLRGHFIPAINTGTHGGYKNMAPGRHIYVA